MTLPKADLPEPLLLAPVKNMLLEKQYERV